MTCDQEMCPHWGGDGRVCNCVLLDIEPGDAAGSITRCDVTDLYADQCAHCTHPETNRPPTVGGKWRTFQARYAGKCVRCGDDFPADVEIGRLDNGAGYVGPCCIKEED